MKNRIAALLLTGTLLTAALAGCGGGKSTPEASASAPAEGQSVSSVESMASVPAAQPEPETESTQEESLAEQPAEIQHLVEFPLEEPFSISISMSTTPSLTGSGLIQDAGQDLGWAKWLHNRTGADIQVDLYSFFDSADKQNLMIASGDYTDVIVGSLSYSGGVDGAVEEGVLTDISEYAAYMPDYMNALYSNVNYVQLGYSTDFHLTAFYGLNDSAALPDYGPVIRQDWLDAQGLEKPVTYDDLHEVLTAFKNAYGATLWLTSYGGVPGDFSGGYGFPEYSGGVAAPLYVEDDQFLFPTEKPEFQDYLKMMHQWYQEGLIYPDFLSQGEVDHPDSALINNGDIGVWFTYVAYLESEQAALSALEPGGDIRGFSYPVKQAGDSNRFGKGAATNGVDGMGGFSVTTASSDVATLCAALNEFYTPDGYTFANWGTENETYTVDADGSKHFTDLILQDEYGLGSAVMMTYYFFKDGPYQVDYDRYLSSYTDRQVEACELWMTENPGIISYTLTTDQSYEFYGYQSDVFTTYQEYVVKFITGDKDIDSDWQGFLDKLDGCGLQSLLELGQTGVEQYDARLEEAEALYQAYHEEK